MIESEKGSINFLLSAFLLIVLGSGMTLSDNNQYQCFRGAKKKERKEIWVNLVKCLVQFLG